MKLFQILGAALLMGLSVAACDDAKDSTVAAVPQEPGPEAIGHYCGMIVANHLGPKGQIFLSDRAEPIWFASVRDTFAFTMLPEERKNITAIYVNDMGEAKNWDRPEPGTWVAAHEAVFVVGSDARGGMGGREVVPFGDRQAAERFRAERGGEIYLFGEIPERYVLGGPDELAASDSHADTNHQKH